MLDRRQTVGVVYLARGADSSCFGKFETFVESYKRWSAGFHHELYVLYKGFASPANLLRAQGIFGTVCHSRLLCDDDSYDVGAYGVASRAIDKDYALFLNTNSSFNAEGWLYKFCSPMSSGVGCVGATGSFEQLELDGIVENPFPNPHIRTNAFMIGLQVFRETLQGVSFATKHDLYRFEAGASSFTRRITSRGLSVAVLGRDGRTYSPEWWPISETFRQQAQENLLIEDNQTRMYRQAPWQGKRLLCERAWGRYLDPTSGSTIGKTLIGGAPLQ